MPDDTPADGTEYDLVFPFVAVTSEGGPYDDQAYCAGYEMGQLDAALAQHPTEHAAVVRTENLAQADLIAMRHGYVRNDLPNDAHPEWTCMEFTPSMEIADA